MCMQLSCLYLKLLIDFFIIIISVPFVCVEVLAKVSNTQILNRITCSNFWQNMFALLLAERACFGQLILCNIEGLHLQQRWDRFYPNMH